MIGLAHLSLAPVLFRDAIRGLLADGIVNSVEKREVELDARGHAFWFVTTGVALLGMAALIGSLERRSGGLSPVVGVVLAGTASWGVTFLPKSGFWSLFLPAMLAFTRVRGR